MSTLSQIVLGNILRSGIAAILCGLAPAVSVAEVFVHVNASQVTYQASTNGYVYIRNMNQFDSNAQGCCYAYWIDTTTQAGKNFYALLLALAAQGQYLYFGIPNGYASGAITFAGVW